MGNNQLKSYVIKDDMNEGMTYGCLIMNKDTEFNFDKFQERLNDIDRDFVSMDNEDYDDIVKMVLNEHEDEYKDIIYVKNEISFYI